MKIGVDIDGVLYQWDKTARYMLRNVLPDSPYAPGGKLGVESQSWSWIEENVAKEHWHWLWDQGVKLGLFRHGHLFPGVIEAMRRLAAVGDVIIITHRPKSAVQDTLEWLAFNRFDIAEVHLLTNMQPKSSATHCDYFIDDKPENVRDIHLNTRARSYLMRREWNLNSFEGCGCVDSLAEFATIVETHR